MFLIHMSDKLGYNLFHRCMQFAERQKSTNKDLDYGDQVE
jgi:hypothetical protein